VRMRDTSPKPRGEIEACRSILIPKIREMLKGTILTLS
jgi:hypothetical protein